MRVIPANCAGRFATYVLLLPAAAFASGTASFSKCVITKGWFALCAMATTVRLPLQIMCGITYALNTDGGNG